MFESNKDVKSGGTPESLLGWFQGAQERTGARSIAHDLYTRAEDAMPTVRQFLTTPQGAPWHCEGPTVADHIQRILTGVVAVGEGTSLLEIEEFAREKDLALEIAHLERTLREHQGLLRAFALAHDLAKPTTLFFDAKSETKGAAEGFAQRGRAQRHPSSVELARYNKLYRAYAATRHGDVVTTTAGFFTAYGIETHYYGHDVEGAKPDFVQERQVALQLCDVQPAYLKLLTELIRQHIAVLGYFGRPDAKKVEVLAALAGRLGLNVDLYLDLTVATMFADAVVGSIQYKNGHVAAQTDLVINFFRAEREALPARHRARVEAEERGKKQAYKDTLAAAGLSGDAVFALLGTPIGPERGDVMARVQAAISDPETKLPFGVHNEELYRRIATARELLAQL